MSIYSLVRKNIQLLEPYQSARRLGGKGNVFLNANEYFSSPKKIALSNSLNRYPESQPKALIESYARYASIKPEQVIVTRGGDEAIQLVIRAFCEPNIDQILYCPPTYSMYQVCAQTTGIKTKIVALTDHFQLDVKKIQSNLDNVKVVFICSPNNPTGNVLNIEDINQLLRLTENKAIVVLDEAYIEFSDNQSMASNLGKYPHLIIIRTLSKAFALAGLRCGFALADSEIIQVLNKVIDPYPIPTPIEEIANYYLSQDGIGQMKDRVKLINENKSKVIEQLRSIKLITHIYPSEANFILFKATDAQALFEYLWNKGIILRDQSKQLLLDDCIRMTIGSDTENKLTIDAIEEFGNQKYEKK